MKNAHYLCIALIIMVMQSVILTTDPIQPKTTKHIVAATITRIHSIENSERKINSIIFDLDGVLFLTSYYQFAQEMGLFTKEGLWNLSYYMIKNMTYPSAKKLYKILAGCPAISTFKAYRQGHQLPQIMVDWKTGAQDLKDVQDAMVKHILNSKLSQEEKNLFITICLIMTTPAKFVESRQIIKGALELLRSLKEQGYKLYILSNCEVGSFNLLTKKFPEMFTYQDKNMFDGVMLASHEKTVKPDLKIYKACLEKFNINPTQAIFIDDTLENKIAAEQMGMQAILCKKDSINALAFEIEKIVKL